MKVTLCVLAAVLAVASAVPNGRIIGGNNAGDGQFPYMVSLRSSANSHFCGGWIHNMRWIVTAAQCTIGRAVANTISVVGTTRLGEGGVHHTTASIANHPNFNANTLANDIALVWTSTQMVRTPLVAPIPLSTVNTGSGVFAVLSGWGLTANPGYQPDIMQWLQKGTMTNTGCRLAHSIGNRSRINDNNICTDNANGMGACTADQGSPLVAGAAVIGAFSWSVPCAQGVPDVFTRVSSHATWIRQIAGDSA